MKTEKFLIPVVLLALLASCGQAPEAPKPTPFKALTVELSDEEVQRSFPAVNRGQQSVEVRPQVGGVITKILVDEGAEVKKGQVMFIIDQVPYRAALNVAKANVKSAEAQVATAKLMVDSKEELFKENVISEYDLQTSRNSLLSAESALALAKANEVNAANNLRYTEVTSPVNGTASMIPYRVGALVSSSITEPLVKVSDDKKMHAYFSLTEAQLLQLMKSDSTYSNIKDSFGDVELRLSDGSTYPLTGRVDAISGTIDPATSAVSVRAVFENPKGILRDGGNSRIIITSTMNDAVTIPASSTFEIQNKKFVYKVVDGTAKGQEIQVNPLSDGTSYIVESGLSAGDVIIREGAGLIRPGQPVVIAQ